MIVKDITFTITTENHPGILFRIAAVFLRRNINIEMLNVAAAGTTLPDGEDASRFTIVVYIGEEMAGKLARQIDKIVGVYRVEYAGR